MFQIIDKTLIKFDKFERSHFPRMSYDVTEYVSVIYSMGKRIRISTLINHKMDYVTSYFG